MSLSPRLLPVLAVAVGGVLAVRALASLEAAPDFLRSAQAWAEEAGPASAGGPASKGGEAPSAAAGAAARSASPAVCAPTAAELAREAGLSPAELRVLQSLQARRGELDLREQSMETQLALLAAAETKLEARVRAMNALKTELTGLLAQAEEKESTEIQRLVTVYQAMRPKDAAAVMASLDDRVLIPVASRMKERSLAAILAQMPPAAARRLTEKLAGRFASTDGMAERIADASGARMQSAARAAAPPPARTAAAPPARVAAPPAEKAAPESPQTVASSPGGA
jgi:flagellar motility protein MotE (MotC chaperone)